MSLCLKWVDSLNLKDKTVIDFGCASGATRLAIVAIKLGTKKAIGIDIDLQAVLASQNNAKQNKDADKLVLYLAKDQPEDLKVNIIIANNLALLAPLYELDGACNRGN
ncbi:MAG: 50S ribosomal protein L11 methyltransferase [Arsenophonus sp. NEOnobi-MAG3]